jgi:hypothetical protein
MFKYLFVFLALIVQLTHEAKAAPVRFGCVLGDGQKASDLTIDLAKRKVVWGEFTVYQIAAVTSGYITFYRFEKIGAQLVGGEIVGGQTVGGEMAVFDRSTGRVVRGSAGLIQYQPQAGSPQFLESKGYQMTCSRKLL